MALSGMTASMSPSQQPTLFTRIRVREKEDLERLHSLITEYADHPERAKNVTEFVFRWRVGSPLYFLTSCPDEWKTREHARDISNETAMRKALQFLNFSPEAEEEWIRVLSWMDPNLVAKRRVALQEQQKAIQRTGDLERWFKDQDMRFAHHATVVLFTMCPNIEKFVYEDNHDQPSIVLNNLRQNNYGLLPRQFLQQLRYVHLIPATDRAGCDPMFYNDMDLLRLLRMFHRLPCIETVRADGISPNPDAAYEVMFPPKTSNIRKIHTEHNWLPSDVIASLVLLPKHLEEFTCTTGGRATFDGGFFIRYPWQIANALRWQKSSLQQLDLDIDEHLTLRKLHRYDEDDELFNQHYDSEEEELYKMDCATTDQSRDSTELYEREETGSTIGSLQDYKKLTHLSIGIKLLLGPSDDLESPLRLVDALPPSLEYLLIRGYSKHEIARYDDQIEELLAMRKERLPFLREIHGIDVCILSGESVDHPDRDEHLVWEAEEADDSWQTLDDFVSGTIALSIIRE